MSHVYYGLLNWGSANSTALESIRRNLRKTVRIIDFAKRQAHSQPIFTKLALLNFDDTYKKHKCEVAKFMFDINSTRGNFQNSFQKASSIHSYPTRFSSKGNFVIPRNTTSYKQRSILCVLVSKSGMKSHI